MLRCALGIIVNISYSNHMLINMVTRAYKKFCILGCCYNISKYLLYKF